MKREGQVKQIPFFELFHDVEVMEYFLGEKLLLGMKNESGLPVWEPLVDQMINLHLKLGYDYCRANPLIGLTFKSFRSAKDTAKMATAERVWKDGGIGTIANWEDFDTYPWPDVSDIDYSWIETAAKRVPEGMKVMVSIEGVFENVRWLMGYEAMAYAIYENPDLVEALFQKVGRLVTCALENAAQIENVGLIVMGEDMGFNTGTLFAPVFFREHVFQWQKNCVDSAHKNGHVFLLHCCGKIDAIMEDLIEYVGIDARHSYQDAVTPVEDVYNRYHDRLAIVGGVDIDLLARGSEGDVRKRTRQILEACAPGGGYIMGTGNSVANYLNMDNYLAMMDETRKFSL